MTRSFRIPILLAVGAALLLPGLGKIVLTRRQEIRVVLTAQNMAQGGSWLVPQFRDELRLRKPPLMYWLVAAAFRLTGNFHSAAVARVPSALAGAALLLVMYAGGARLVGRRRAFIGAMVLATSFLFFKHSRLAETNITLTLFTALTALLVYAGLQSKHPAGYWRAAGLAAGLGFLTKGPAPLVMPLLATIAFTACTPRCRRKGWWRPALPAFIIFLATGLSWYAFILFRSDMQGAAGQAVESELGRTLATSSHQAPFYYYFHMLPGGLLPWGLLAPFAIWHAWKYGRRHAGIRFLLAWLFTSFVLLSVLASKQEHYTLLLEPPCALLIGYFLGGATSPSARRWRTRIIRGYLAGLLALVGLISGALLLSPVVRDDIPPWLAAAFGSMLLLVSILAWWPAFPSGPRRRLVLAMLALLLCFPAHVFVLYGALEDKGLIPEFVEAAKPRLREAGTIYQVGRFDGSLEFYSQRRIMAVASLEDAWPVAKPGDAVVLSEDPAHPAPGEAVPQPPDLEKEQGHLRLKLFIKPWE